MALILVNKQGSCISRVLSAAEDLVLFGRIQYKSIAVAFMPSSSAMHIMAPSGELL